jgi:hypothetical protein
MPLKSGHLVGGSHLYLLSGAMYMYILKQNFVKAQITVDADAPLIHFIQRQ